MDISIIILNWNGLEFLEQSIPSIISAVDVYDNNCEVIVVDSGSSDQSIDYVNSNFPKIRVISLNENLAFTKAMNIGIKEAKRPLVICLNNDIIVDKGFIAPLVSHFSDDKNLFAVASKMLLWDKNTLNFGRTAGSFRYGFFTKRIFDSATAAYTLYACAGGLAVDKDKFWELGGFDEDMIIYWEDLDLCYRAWKQGWKTIYEPRSIIYHKFHGTYAKKCGENGIGKISGENYLLFVLKNIHDRTLFYPQLFLLPVLILAAVLAGKSHFAIGLLRSLRRWPLFFKKRCLEKKKAIFSDKQVFWFSGQ